MNFDGWEIDLPKLYGKRWKDRERFRMTEHLYPSPFGDRALLFFAVGEVGMNKQVGRVALFASQNAPRLLYYSEDILFWFEGPAEPVVLFFLDLKARLYEFSRPVGKAGAFGVHERTLDCRSGVLSPR